jgi:predicted component of type VI protein secretion system
MEVMVVGDAASALSMWKGLSVQFTGGKIASVEMKTGDVQAMKSSTFFMAADLSGQGHQWPLGHAATVTFEADTDMDAVAVDYDSMNTYLVHNTDPKCVPSAKEACHSVTTRGPIANLASASAAVAAPKTTEGSGAAKPDALDSKMPKTPEDPKPKDEVAAVVERMTNVTMLAMASGGLLAILLLLALALVIRGRRSATTASQPAEFKESNVSKC